MNPSKIELVFLHLPKTGGSSILKALYAVYGEAAVRHFERDECIALNHRGLRISDILGEEVKVIHGHFLYEEVDDLVRRDRPKLITFLRNPTDRLISNYQWWKHTLNSDPNHPEKRRVNEPIEIYACRPETQNKMSRFLKGSSIDDFFFIGFLESFAEDLASLGKLLNWPELPPFHEKNGAKIKGYEANKVGDASREQISALNKSDWSLYEKSLALKQERALLKGKTGS